MSRFNTRKIAVMIIDALMLVSLGILVNLVLMWVDIYNNVTPDGSGFCLPWSTLTLVLGIEAMFCFFSLFVAGAYSFVWRLLSKRKYLACALGVTAGMMISVALLTFFDVRKFAEIPPLAFIIPHYLLTLCGTVTLRAVLKTAFLRFTEVGREESGERTLIVGAGRASMMLLSDIENAKNDPNNPSRNILPVGLVDDDRTKYGSKIKGVSVLGSTEDIPKLCEQYSISLIVFAIPSASEEERKEILSLCSQTKCKIKMVPYLSQLLFDDNHPQLLNQVKDINIEDLLGRDSISFDREVIREFIKDKTLMVTGGGGSIGSELVRQIANYNPKKIIIVDIYENNAYDIQQELLLEHGTDLDVVTLIASVRDYDKMDLIMRKYRPDVVFHAAAHKHVPLMETSPEEAVKNNIFGTYNMATLAEKYEVQKFIMISTDKAVNPTNVMGATKRCCEMIVQYKSQQGSKTEFVTTRFGNVLGSNGSVIPLFRRQIESGKPVTVTHPDIIRYFMTIPEAVSLVLQAGAMANGGEIFVLDMGDPVKITTLAENLIRMYGKVPYRDVEIKFTGLRPGEKLFEELLMNEEGLKSTANKKIFIGNQIAIDEEDLLKKLGTLKAAAEENDSEKTVEILSDIVPTFNHKVN
ncbi:MAG: nucleoside-diphosphate sugar epimerase/dehydratase [Eubacteriales bacterium]|nr:nucleoside-diphosphate sugar epimerase/dehydratase [Eubacteriales bacterium]